MARHTAEPEHRESRPADQLELWERHHEVIRYVLLGYGPTEISRMTGLSISYVSALTNSPIAREQLQILTAAKDANAVDAAATIANVQGKAAAYLARVIEEDADIPVSYDRRIAVCQDMLSRGGNSPITRGTFEHSHRKGLSEETLNQIKQRGQDAIARARAHDADFEMLEGEQPNELESNDPFHLDSVDAVRRLA